MRSASGRWVVAFNGEIYNHQLVREELERAGEAPDWRGQSDTETLLAAVEAWGVVRALDRFVGMFAFSVWDRESRELWLVRDRLGEKPLYYGWNRGVFLFGSELKSFRRLPGFVGDVDREALALFLRHNAVPAPFSIYQGIRKLLPGHWLKLGMAELIRGDEPAPVAYWTAAGAAHGGVGAPIEGTEEEALDQLEDLLGNAISLQMVADVPLGAFLSGGVDSSTVVSLMQARSGRAVRTFSIGFNEKGYNEAEHAAAVARHLGTEHTEMYVSSRDALATIPQIPRIYDEPFSDSSQIPTILVANLARKHVTVALSGDGGDELFGGYSRYFLAARLWGRIERVPRPLRAVVAKAMAAVPIRQWNAIYQQVSPMVPASLKLNLPGDRLHKAASVLAQADGRGLYRGLISHWDPKSILLGAVEPRAFGPPRGEPMPNLIDYMMLEDACHYLPDDILVKVDRASMAASLEARVPFLDHRVFEFAWRLPQALKVRRGVGKYLLRKLLYRYVPAALIDRPKMGFGVPIGSWLRGPLREWGDALLSSDRLREDGYFDPQPIERMWQEHQMGTRDWQYHLWDVLMFQSWLDAEKA